MSSQILWFASNNEGKVKDLKYLLEPHGYIIKSLLDITTPITITETGTSFIENAILKATTLAKLVNAPVIGDDSGLEIFALDNFPGLYSARWMGKMSYLQAMTNILEQMKDVTERKALFICAIAYVDLSCKTTKTFIGKLEGEITTEIKGNSGFGYDQIFYVPALHATLGEMSLEDKNKISHRYSAIMLLLFFLKNKVSK